MLFREPESGAHHTVDQVERELAEIRQNLAKIKSVVAVASAKGGCGKSALTVNLAASLAIKGRKVGIIDADLNAPSIAHMLGMTRIQLFPVTGGVEPATGPLGLRVIGTDLLVDSAKAPISFDDTEPPPPPDGTLAAEISESQALRDLASQTKFSALDMLLIDLATGLDHLQRVVEMVNPNGVVLVTQPTELALEGTRRMVDAASGSPLPILGIVENMAGFNCGGCHSVRPLLPQGNSAALARELNLPLFGRLPFDERLADACDRGVPFVRECPDALLTRMIAEVAQRLEEALSLRPRPAEAVTPPHPPSGS